MYVEKSLCDKDNKLMIHQATLRKLKRRLHILQQMNDAPQVYARAIVEVVRRKAFSKNFLEVFTMSVLTKTIYTPFAKLFIIDICSRMNILCSICIADIQD